MNYTIDFEIDTCCYPLDIDGKRTFRKSITEDLNTIVSYLYQEHFNTPYNELGWWLLPGAKEFVKDIEEKWLHNELDTFKIYHEDNFKEFLQENCSNYLTSEDLEVALDTLKDDCIDELNCMDLEELKDLPSTIYIDVDMGDYSMTDYINVDDFIDELEEDED